MITDKTIRPLLSSKSSNILLDVFRNRGRFYFSNLYLDDLIIIEKREGSSFKYFLRDLNLFWNEEQIINERKELQSLLFNRRIKRRHLLKRSSSEGDVHKINLKQIKKIKKAVKRVTFADDNKYLNLCKPMESINIYNNKEIPIIPKSAFDNLNIKTITYPKLIQRFSTGSNNERSLVQLIKVTSVEDVIQFEASIRRIVKENVAYKVYVSYKRNFSNIEEKVFMMLHRITELEQFYSIAIMFEHKTDRIDFKIVLDIDREIYNDDNGGEYYTMSA